MAIVCMVNQTAMGQFKKNANFSENFSVYFNKANSSTKNDFSLEKTPLDGPFLWEKNVQGHILGSYFYGYMISHIPGGIFAENFGGKYVMTVSLIISTLATFLTPLAAYTNIGLLIFVQVLGGLGAGMSYPAMHSMLGHWSPPLERATLCALTYSGTVMGMVVALPVSAFLCQYGFSQKWDSVFYVIAMSSSVCILFWVLMTSSTPSQHPTISENERSFIFRSLEPNELTSTKGNWLKTPWKDIFTSGPVWAIIISNFCFDWGFLTFIANMPAYYNEVLLFDISLNGFFSAGSFLGFFVVMIFAPLLSDNLLRLKVFSVVTTRKIFNTIGLVIPAFLLIALSFMDSTQSTAAATLMVLTVSIGGFVFAGFMVNHIDIAPQYAGSLIGLSNGIAASSGFLAPTVTAYITENQTRESWQIVFFTIAVISVAGALFYNLLAAADVQHWAIKNSETIKILPNKN